MCHQSDSLCVRDSQGRRLWGQLLAQLTLLLPLLQYAWGQCASGNKDPHLNFAHGGTADFRGRDKTHFNFFSGPKLSVNVLIEDATFVITDDKGSLTVDGTYILRCTSMQSSAGRSRSLCICR